MSPRKLALDQFWARVEKTGSCWLWRGPKLPNGYGRFGGAAYAHRFSWSLANGPIPEGMQVLHRCDVRACCNPAHLFLGTQADNMRDMREKGRGTLGIRDPMAKLTDDHVRVIRHLVARTSLTHVDIGRLFGVVHATVTRAALRQSWRHVTGDALAREALS